MSIDDLLDKLEKAEQEIVNVAFLAPVVKGSQVRIRIAGIICDMDTGRAIPPGFQGWAIFKARSTSKANFVRQANLSEVSAYLALLPAVRLILVHGDGNRWLALQANRGDSRFQITGPVPLLLADEGLRRFETVIGRFDGQLFWYERLDPSRDPAIADYLRGRLAQRDQRGLPPEPGTLRKAGLSPEERAAYTLAWIGVAEEVGDKAELAISEALSHAGAEYHDYIERGGNYVVRFTVDGQPHITTVRQDDLSLVTAGICLAGQDRRFDLTSLVSVLREAQGGRQLVWIGRGGLPEEEYWRIHPPEEP